MSIILIRFAREEVCSAPEISPLSALHYSFMDLDEISNYGGNCDRADNGRITPASMSASIGMVAGTKEPISTPKERESGWLVRLLIYSDLCLSTIAPQREKDKLVSFFHWVLNFPGHILPTKLLPMYPIKLLPMFPVHTTGAAWCISLAYLHWDEEPKTTPTFSYP